MDGVTSRTVSLLLFSLNKCQHMWSILLVPGIKAVVKQPVDKILAGMLANKARTCIGTRPQANTSLINQPQNNS